MSLWKDIPLGENAPEEINTIIEIPRGSNNKYEIDKDTGLISLDRANYSSAPFPFDYGFAPQTLWEDDDPLDIIVLTTYPLYPGILVKVRPVAVMEMIDSGESDYKVITVPTDDRRFETVQDIDDVNPHSLREFKHFFETYKELKDDKATQVPVEIHGFKGKKEAHEAIEKSVEIYKKEVE
ncbi:MAG: inorganic diphosphatase [Candidatus Campbellbacteria bacterium]|nr:inorganic diphosphatase [Candidatus Campbellbacteria bacterium]